MTIRIAERVRQLKPSVTVAVANRAKQMVREGVDVLQFTLGEPDFDTPQRIKDAAIKAMQAGETKYMPTLGDPETRKVVADKLTNENKIPGLSPEHIAISSGGKHTLFVLLHCLVDPPAPGEEAAEAIIPVPAWVSYRPICEMAGAEVREIPTGPETSFKISPEQLRQAISPRSRVLFLNSPSNPCGTMYSESELRALAKVIHETRGIAPDLVVITDEIYEKIVYAGIDHFSIGSVPEIAERTVTVNGLSKAFAMTGWRVGYCGCPGEAGAALIKAMGTLQGQMTTNITSFNYAATRCALTECAGEVEEMRRAFGERAVVIQERLAEIPGMVMPKCTGAFYAFPDVSAHFGKKSPEGRPINSALEFSEALLLEAKMAVIPGEDFGGCGKNHIRISFACSTDQIHKGMDRLRDFVASLR